MRQIVIFGVVLALLGLLGIAIPVFTTEQTKDVAKLGDFKVQTKEDTNHVIPPLLSEGALALGIVLIGGGLIANRS